MKCSHVDNLLLPLFLGELDADPSHGVREHLTTCHACAQRYEHLRNHLARLAIALPSEALGPQLKKHIVPPSPQPPQAGAGGRKSRWLTTVSPSLVGATVAAAVVLAALLPKIHDEQQHITKLQASLAIHASQLSNLRRTAQQRAEDLTRLEKLSSNIWQGLSALGSPHVKILTLQAASRRSHAWGRILQDPGRQHWYLMLSDLKPPPQHRIYQLWFITNGGQKLPGKTFRVTPHGHASLQIAPPRDAKQITACAITTEPEGGSAEPTGQITMRGEIK